MGLGLDGWLFRWQLVILCLHWRYWFLSSNGNSIR